MGGPKTTIREIVTLNYLAISPYSFFSFLFIPYFIEKS